ncbi:MAG: lycopene cyclase domain-containing protein, partial [Xanthomarina sp.]
MEIYTYLLVNLACISIPFIASFYPKHAFYKDWKPFFKANLIVTLLFVIWDAIFTNIGIWGFNKTYLIGINIVNLPLEEVLFFICIPYACVFSYFAFQYFFKTNILQESQAIISYVLIAILLVGAIFNYERLYTTVTFFATSIYLMYLVYKKIDLSLHYLSYLFVMPFFILSNGVLTGSFLVDPIVWYNDAENLGI